MAPCLVCLGTNDQISPAVVADVGVDAVDCSTQVRVSTISIARGVFLGCGQTIQSLWLGSPCHLSIPLLTTESGSRDFGVIPKKNQSGKWHIITDTQVLQHER